MTTWSYYLLQLVVLAVCMVGKHLLYYSDALFLGAHF